ncbi:MAG: hypothetical protein ACKPHQ_18635, partial [Dolichospermum sp.]
MAKRKERTTDIGSLVSCQWSMVSGKEKRTDNRQRTTDNGQRTTDNGQQTTDNGQQTTNITMATTERKPLLLDFEKPLAELATRIEQIRQLAEEN